MSVSSAADLESRQDVPSNETPIPEIPADAAHRKRRAWGCGILISLALATPVVLLVGAWLIVYWSSEGLAEEALAKARAAGDPVTGEQMQAYYPTSPEIDAATAHWLRATAVVKGPTISQDVTGVPGFDPSLLLDSRDPLALANLDATLAFIERHREAIEAACAARNAGAVARFPIHFEDGMATLLPDVQAMRDLSRLLELDLKANLAQGKVDVAVEDLLSTVAASEGLSNEPILVSQLVRFAIFSVAVADLQHLLARTDLSDEQLARLQAAFGRQSFHDGFRRSLRGEQWLLIHAIRIGPSTGDPNVDRLRMLPFRGADLAKGMDFWRTTIDASDEGLLEGLEAARAMQEEKEGVVDSPFERMQYPVTAYLVPGVESGVLAALAAEANARLAETAIACERYRLARGKYPKKLEDLVPEYLGEAPLDPMDRQPLRYAVDEAGATLYSIGRDQIDDGGTDEPTEGDLVFRLISSKGKTQGANPGKDRNGDVEREADE